MQQSAASNIYKISYIFWIDWWVGAMLTTSCCKLDFGCLAIFGRLPNPNIKLNYIMIGWQSRPKCDQQRRNYGNFITIGTAKRSVLINYWKTITTRDTLAKQFNSCCVTLLCFFTYCKFPFCPVTRYELSFCCVTKISPACLSHKQP